MELVVFTLPGNVTTNPYLSLLYESIKKEDPQIDVRSFSWRSIALSLIRQKSTLIHIHWETNVYGSAYRLVSLLRGGLRFVGLSILRVCGARIVWTLHNPRSHDYPHPRIDALGRAIMWRLAQVVIIQNDGECVRQRKAHPSQRICFVPIGNYVGVYGARRDHERATLRNTLGYVPSDIVLVSLGLVRPYKGYEQVIDAVLAVSLRGIPIKLLIAGKGDSSYIQALHARAGNSPAIVIREGYVPDEEMSSLLAVSDFGIIAYNDGALASAVLMMLLSYGVPALIAHMPAAEVVHDRVNGFHIGAETSLAEFLEKLPLKPRLDRDRVAESMKPYEWARVARDTLAAYHTAL